MNGNAIRNLQLYDYGVSLFIHNTINGRIVKIPSASKKLVEDFLNGLPIDRNNPTISAITEHGLVSKNSDGYKAQLITKSRSSASYSLRFHVSKLCNLDCNYCHVFRNNNLPDDKPLLMDLETICEAIDAYINAGAEYKKSIYRFSFYGGEPLFNWITLKKAIAYGNQRIMNSKDEIEWILNTNGTMITEKMAKFFSNENVDVHVSIDGPDDVTNANRNYKSGRNVFKSVIKALYQLKKHDCKVQFDSCLTKENFNKLNDLIDLAIEVGADRIYLAQTDTVRFNDRNLSETQRIAETLIDASRYADSVGVGFGGPWKCFWPWFQMNRKTNQPFPDLVADTNGQMYLSSYPDYKFGHISQVEKLFSDPVYKKVKKNLRLKLKTCNGCDIEGVCSGYLKAMVRYHTGSTDGYSKECDLAKAVFKTYLKDIGTLDASKLSQLSSVADATLLYTPLVHSAHVCIQKKKGSYVARHTLSGKALEVSRSTLEFLDCFKNTTKPVELLTKYDIIGLVGSLRAFVRNKLLHSPDYPEELDFLTKQEFIKDKEKYQTANCICFSPPKNLPLAIAFTGLIESVYDEVPKQFKRLDGPIIINLVKDSQELSKFWMVPDMPKWVKGFVALNRVLVIDVQQLQYKQFENEKYIESMKHELFHILLNHHRIRLPVWLEEGVCEFFAKKLDVENFTKLRLIKKMLTFEELEEKVVHTLLDIDNARTNDNICYQQSHSFVDYLCKKRGIDIFINFLHKTSFRDDFSSVYRNSTGVSLKDEELAWRRQLKC